MDSTAFEALVTRSEALAARNPVGYRRRVLALALLGYLYLALVILLLLGLTILCLASLFYLRAVAIKLVFITGAPLVLVLRSLWLKVGAPDGVLLTREVAPELFRMLDGLRRRLDTPRLHNVLLSGEFNAAVRQVPRLGLLGWHRNYLIIGLPLMKALSVEQFEAVLAHELGHLSRGHARVGNWIYRLRVIWQRLDETFSQTSRVGAALIRPFFRRYIPYFAAVSFPLARANEYEADAASVKLTSARSAAQALTGVDVIGSYLAEKYWPAIQARARDLPQPSIAPYRDFAMSAVQEVPVEEVARWQEAALAQKTSHTDTHPCLADRLKGIGMQAEFAPPLPGQSAERLLSPSLPRLERALDDAWRKDVADVWRKTFENSQAGRARLTELRSRALQSPLEEASAVELAGLEEEFGDGPITALAMRRELALTHPGSLVVRFDLAGHLLRHDDAEGVAPMESVISADPNAFLSGAQLLRDYYSRQDDMTRALHWHEQLLKRASMLQSAQRERDYWLTSDVLVQHQLPAAQLAELIQQFKQIAGLTRVYLVRKLVQHFPENPLYILGFQVRKWWSFPDQGLTHAIQQRIKQEIRFPGETLIVNTEGRNARFARMLRRVRGARIL
jgi:Zn-dependent protease with chaperone function